MLIKKFPVPCRVDYVPSPYEPDEDGWISITSDPVEEITVS
jgi:hypothetical protein